MNGHLNHHQLSDLLLESSQHPGNEPLREHLSHCPQCASELEAMRRTVTLFRDSATAYAERRLATGSIRVDTASTVLSPRRTARLWLQPVAWAAVAATVIAIAIPASLHRHAPVAAPGVTATRQAPPEASISDEALLEGVNQDLSAEIPTALQPLADPTASASQNASQETLQRKN
ncbi:MAG: hypothetical protein KGK08_08315 [Acidobacteriota bacterium]|nr:hypothetical protein [Acidobacteriota bacterium]